MKAHRTECSKSNCLCDGFNWYRDDDKLGFIMDYQTDSTTLTQGTQCVRDHWFLRVLSGVSAANGLVVNPFFSSAGCGPFLWPRGRWECKQGVGGPSEQIPPPPGTFRGSELRSGGPGGSVLLLPPWSSPWLKPVSEASTVVCVLLTGLPFFNLRKESMARHVLACVMAFKQVWGQGVTAAAPTTQRGQLTPPSWLQACWVCASVSPRWFLIN